jgi:hypothetical protein
MEKPDRSGSIILGGLTMLFGLGGLVLLAVGISQWLAGESTRRWDTTPGIIIHSQMVERQGSTGMYQVDIRYSYTVGNTPYEGSRISLADSASSNLGETYHLAEKYRTAGQVTVYYDTQNPASAILDPGPASFTWIWFLIGGGFILPGLILGYFWRRMAQYQQMETKPANSKHS